MKRLVIVLGIVLALFIFTLVVGEKAKKESERVLTQTEWVEGERNEH